MGRSTSAVRGPEALAHDTLATKRAGVLVDDRALGAEGLIEGDTVVRKAQQPGQPALAVLDRLTPDVLAVGLKQVERAEDRGRVGAKAGDVSGKGCALTPPGSLTLIPQSPGQDRVRIWTIQRNRCRRW
jgi:hypothetical protein